jgi:hypothetical protein
MLRASSPWEQWRPRCLDRRDGVPLEQMCRTFGELGRCSRSRPFSKVPIRSRGAPLRRQQRPFNIGHCVDPPMVTQSNYRARFMRAVEHAPPLGQGHVLPGSRMEGRREGATSAHTGDPALLDASGTGVRRNLGARQQTRPTRQSRSQSPLALPPSATITIAHPVSIHRVDPLGVPSR